MSGPKVVRIVTREEAIAVCEQRLREAGRALADWQSRLAELGQADAASAALVQGRLAQLRELLAQDRFLELQDAVKYELGFLKGDLAEREQRAVEQAASALAMRRQAREKRSSLLAALARQEGAEATKLAERLRSAPESALEATLAEGYAWLGKKMADAAAEAPLDSAQRELASALGSAQRAVDFASWRAAQEPAARDPRLARIDRHLAELSLLGGAELAAPFQQRLARIEAEGDSGRRGMLLDSLQLELAAACRHDAKLREELTTLRRLLAEAIATQDPATAAELAAAVETAAKARDLSAIETLSQRCQSLIDTALSEQAASARRQAVLQALSGLGYEVHEGMATAWARDGRLALRKTASPGYGLEVGGQAEHGRLQLRPVAFGTRRDPRRDQGIETQWCADFQQLQTSLQESGDQLHIERALAIGQVPLKELANPPETRRSTSSSSTRARTR